ncbi:hypothetical protein BDAP_002507 [Binucleata daphniae]
MYVSQMDNLERCIADLPSHMYNRIFMHKKEWSEAALFDIIKMFENVVTKQDIIRAKYLECFEIIAEYNAKRFVCFAFEIAENEVDKIQEYATIEYYKCIEEKNLASKKPIMFSMPKIGIKRERSYKKKEFAI